MDTGSRFGRELLWLGVFAAAFGYLESTVVVYLRTIAYGGDFSFPLRPISPLIMAAEVGREAATIVMLAAPALAPGGRGFLKFARFLYCFGLWDVFYYVGLKALLGWPPSPLTWDILFLIPVPWSAPVLAPASIAVYFVAVGAYGIIRRGDVRTTAWQATLAIGGTVLIFVTFLWNVKPCLDGAPPASYPWLLFGAGFAALAAAFGGAFFETQRRRKTQNRVLTLTSEFK
jgi:hypothetical protein